MLVGQGGFGKVYRATLRDGTLVAVKQIERGMLDAIQQSELIKEIKQIHKEINIISQLDHKNVLK